MQTAEEAFIPIPQVPTYITFTRGMQIKFTALEAEGMPFFVPLFTGDQRCRFRQGCTYFQEFGSLEQFLKTGTGINISITLSTMGHTIVFDQLDTNGHESGNKLWLTSNSFLAV